MVLFRTESVYLRFCAVLCGKGSRYVALWGGEKISEGVHSAMVIRYGFVVSGIRT